MINPLSLYITFWCAYTQACVNLMGGFIRP